MDDIKLNIKTGDMVTFFSEQEEEDGYLSKFNDASILEHNKSKESVFKIYPFTQYTARKAIKKKNKRRGELQQQQSMVIPNNNNNNNNTSSLEIPKITTTLSSDQILVGGNERNSITLTVPGGGSGGSSGTSSPQGSDSGQTTPTTDMELKQLEEYQDLEESTNESTLMQLEGRDLVYGQIIQLFHPISNQYLFAKNYDKVNHSVVGFRPEGDQKCYFKITPRFQQLDGTKVFNEDLVILRHEKSGLFLKEANFFNDHGVFDICLSDSQPTFWRISVAELDGKSNQNLVRSNEPFRLFHREGGFVKVANHDKTTFTYNTKTPSSINSIFEIELDQTQISSTSPTGTTSGGGGGGGNSSNVNSSSTSIQTPSITVSSSQVPIIGNKSTEIRFGQRFWIKLLGTEKYLSLSDTSQDLDQYKDTSKLILVGKEKKNSPNSTFTFNYVKEKVINSNPNSFDEVTFGSFVRIQSLTKQWLHLMTEESFHHNGDLVGTKKYYKYDDFQIKQIPKSQIEDYNFVSSRIVKISSFLKDSVIIGQKKVTLQDIKAILNEFIKFCTQSEIEDPLEREGTPIKSHQKILAYQSHLPVLLDLLKRFFDFPTEPMVIVCIYRILKQLCKSNIKNAIIINERIQFISGPPHLRDNAIAYGLGSILMEMYKNNNILLEALTPERVQDFIETIKKTKDHKHLEILSEICACFGKPVVKNQQYLCDLLLVKNSSILMKTRFGQRLEIQNIFKGGEWVDIGKFHNLDEKAQKYFEQTISLYSNISKGRNYNGIRLSEKLCTYKECVTCLKDESLPYSLRGCYLNVLIHVYMDCYPQTYTAQISYIWNPKIMETDRIKQILETHSQTSNGTVGTNNQTNNGSLNQPLNPLLNPLHTVVGSPTQTNNLGILTVQSNSSMSSPVNSNSLTGSLNQTLLSHSRNRSHDQGQNNIILSPLISNQNNLNNTQSIQNQNLTGTSNMNGSLNGASTSGNTPILISPLNLSPPIENSSVTTFKESDIFSTFIYNDAPIGLDHANINQLLLNFLSNVDFQLTGYQSQRPKWLFFHKILVAIYYAFKFGFFKRKERSVLKRLVNLLQMENHEGPLITNMKDMDLGRTIGGSRILEDDSIILINIKIEILKTLHLMLSLQKKNILEVFLYDAAIGDQVLSMEDTTQDQAKLILLNRLSMFQRDLNQDLSICSTIFGLLKHENNQLSSLSLSFLNRIYKYRSIYAMLKGPLDKVFYLYHEHINTYKETQSKIDQITRICLLDSLTDDKTNLVLKYLAYFINLCQDPDAEKSLNNQKILQVMDIHKAIVGLLKIGCSLEDLFDNEDYIGYYKDHDSMKANITQSGNGQSIEQTIYISKIFKSCYEFLKVYCRNNKENQKILFGEIEFIIGHLIRYGNVFGNVETLIQIFKSNIELCIEFGNSPYLKILVNFILTHQDLKNLDPIFLRLLSVIMLPGGDNAVIENQIHITNLIKEQKDKIIKHLLVPVSVITTLIKDSKAISKYTASQSNYYKLHHTLEECLLISLQQFQDDNLSISTSTANNNNNNTLKVPKLVRQSAKQQLISTKSNVEVLPRDFVLNLDLILLLKTCSHGKNTPTEAICREFLTMFDCLDILVVQQDNNQLNVNPDQQVYSNLMIPELKELYLENNLTFRFKSAYLSFLHEVYFNSDTLKGDLLALQSNENLWKLIGQFSFQLNSLYTYYSTNHQSNEYFISMGRNLILPMICILERFYSQCFYYDKATQKHIHNSSSLMANLMKLYHIDNSKTKGLLSIGSTPSGTLNSGAHRKTNFKLGNKKQDDQNLNVNPLLGDATSLGGLHPILHELTLEEKISIYSYLSKCLKSMDRSAISPLVAPNISNLTVTDVIRGCEEVIQRLDHQNSRWGRSRTETVGGYETSLSSFVKISPILSSKPSSNFYVRSDSDDKYIRICKKRGFDEIAKIVFQLLEFQNYISNNSNQLQLQQQQQQQQNDNSNNGKSSSNNSIHLANDHKLMSYMGSYHSITSNTIQNNSNTMSNHHQSGSEKSTNFLEILVFQLRNSLYDNDRMKINCIRILSSLLMLSQEKKNEIQNLMSDLYCHSAAIGLLGTGNPEIAFEALALLLRLLESKESQDNCLANPKVKDDIISYFASSPDINFFRDIHAMIERAKINLRDTKRLFRLDNSKIHFSGNLKLTNLNLNTFSRKTEDPDGNPYAKEFQQLQNIFKVLQLLCQGQANVFKKYMISQPDNYKSYDILKEMCHFLKVLETIVDIDHESIDLTIRFFSCMKEIVKNAPENQLTVTNVQVCKAICNILRKHHYDGQDSKYLDLKIEVVDFLLFVVDKEDPRVVTRLIPELDYKVIESTTQVFINQRFDLSEKSIKLASMSFRLIKILADHDKSQNQQLAECLLKCGEHCKSRIGRVELLHYDKLERIYFPIPSFSRRLILEDKEHTKIKSDENILQENLEDHFMDNKVSWNKTSEKIESFMDWSEYKLIELEHLHILKSHSISYLLVSHNNKFKYISFILALVINILLIIYSTGEPESFKSDIGNSRFFGVLLPISLVQTVACLLSCITFFLRYGSVILYQNWVAYLKTHNISNSLMFKTSNEKINKLKEIYKYSYIPLNIKFLLTDITSMYHILAVACAILGLTVSPFFYAFHILQFSLKTKALGIVIRALSRNKKSLMVMGIFILQATYLLSIFSFLFFSEKYKDADGNPFCTTLFQCFLSNVFYGVPTSGQLVQFIEYISYRVDSNSGTGDAVAWTIYNLIFYIIISLILLNVILGIIVDTFGQIRDQRSDTESYKSNYCFICSIDRETFQKKGIDFVKHVEDDHNKWHYLYFFAYLKERINNDKYYLLNETEIYVLEHITNRNYLKFFPVEMSMSLQVENQSQNPLSLNKDNSLNPSGIVNSTQVDITAIMNKSFEDFEKKVSNTVTIQLNQTILTLLDEIKSLKTQLDKQNQLK